MNRQLRKIETPHNKTAHNKNYNQTTQQTLTQEQKVNLENLKRIMNEKKTTLPSLRNIGWRIVKTEMEKINQEITYI